jgi:hypothetical protein
VDEAQRHIKLAERFMQRCVRPLRGRLYENRPVLCSNASFAQPRNVSTKSRLNLAHVERCQVTRLGFEQHRWQIVVRINERSLLQKRLGSVEQLWVGNRRVLSRGAHAHEHRIGENRGTCNQTCLLKKTAA